MDETKQESPVLLNEYTCERCGFVYNKTFDYAPFLCYRCMRYIAKHVFKTMMTITPPISRGDNGEI